VYRYYCVVLYVFLLMCVCHTLIEITYLLTQKKLAALQRDWKWRGKVWRGAGDS